MFDLDILTHEQRELWDRCLKLWELSRSPEAAPVRAALHPAYVGWVTGAEHTHDREAAVASVGPASPRVLDYELMPLAVEVFEGRTGVIHYRYHAQVASENAAAKAISGCWTEVYIRNDVGEWIMIAVSGGPDGER